MAEIAQPLAARAPAAGAASAASSAPAAGAASAAAPAGALVRDALGRAVRLPGGRPRRVVSLVPSLTELLYALGCGGQVAGVSDYCLHPAEALSAVPRVGGQKDPDLARLLALAPDLVLCAKEENLRRDVEALERAGVPVYVTDVRTVPEALALPAELGGLLGAEPAVVAALRASMEAGVEEARRLAAGGPPLRVLVPVWREPWIVAAADTYIDAVLTELGAVNAAAGLGSGQAAGQRRYPKATAAQLLALSPERVLLPSEPYPFGPEHLPLARQELGAEPVLCDGTVLCWYGPRLGRLPELARALRR